MGISLVARFSENFKMHMVIGFYPRDAMLARVYY